MSFSLEGPSHEILWLNLGLLAFAIIFFILGASRIVEFKDLTFSKLTRAMLIGIHCTGTLCFSASILCLIADDPGTFRPFANALFLGAIFTLFPLHIYLAIKRRIEGNHHT